jgi:hypothetical protein
VLACACSAPQVAPAGDAALDAPPAWTGRVWLATDASAPRGALRIFLADGTLVMDSCFETYQLSRWKSLNAQRIEWQEDTSRLEAEVVAPAPDQLQLKIAVGREIKEEGYRLADVPFVCPDMPR